MPKRKQPELTPEEQFERFIETARELEAEESGRIFEKTFEKIIPQKRHTTKPPDT
jgi:hypothetical protein